MKKTETKYSILPVLRSKDDARRSYDRISRFYDYTEGIFEKKYINMVLEKLNIYQGEIVLEIGFGTGNALIKIAEQVGKNGEVYGIDISPGMCRIASSKIIKRSFTDRISLDCGDAVKLPYPDNRFNAVFLSFALELFDTSEISKLLKEIKRVLKSKGKIGVVSLSKDHGKSFFLRLYEWAHIKFPKYIDCRPIYVSRSIEDAGFNILYKYKTKIFLVPIEIVIGFKPPFNAIG